MARTKGSLNKNSGDQLPYMKLSIEERVKLLAIIIVDNIQTDQQSGLKLLKKLEGSHGSQTELI